MEIRRSQQTKKLVRKSKILCVVKLQYSLKDSYSNTKTENCLLPKKQKRVQIPSSLANFVKT